MKRNIMVGIFTGLSSLIFVGVAHAASSPIVNGSFQTGDFTGWIISDSTHCRFGICGNGTAAVQNCLPAAPGDADGHCAVLSGPNVWISQGLPATSAHQYTFGACAKHSGPGSVQVTGTANFALSGDTGWVCQTKTVNNPYGVPQRLPAIGATVFPDSKTGLSGTAYVDQFTFTVNKP